MVKEFCILSIYIGLSTCTLDFRSKTELGTLMDTLCIKNEDIKVVTTSINMRSLSAISESFETVINYCKYIMTGKCVIDVNVSNLELAAFQNKFKELALVQCFFTKKPNFMDASVSMEEQKIGLSKTFKSYVHKIANGYRKHVNKMMKEKFLVSSMDMTNTDCLYCPISGDNFTTLSTICTLECNHCFSLNAIVEWCCHRINVLSPRFTCPICRKTYVL